MCENLNTLTIMLVDNQINAVSQEELENDSRVVFNENDEQVGKDLSDIKHWISSTPHMVNTRTDDLFLKLFLRGCNYNVKDTKEKLDMYFTVRSLLPNWFDNWDPTEANLQKIIRAGVFLPLQGYDKLGRYSILVRMGQIDPCIMAAEDCYKVFIMIFNMVLEGNVQAQTKGMSLIVDMEGMGACHSTMMNPNLLKKLVIVFQEAYPMDSEILVDLSRLYFLNMPKILEKLFSIFLSFLNKRYKKMMKIQDKDCSTMSEEMGEDILPGEYGGSNRTCDELTSFWEEELTRQTPWLMAQRDFKTDESARVGKSKLQNMLSCSIM